MLKPKNILIVGGGLAGSFIAMESCTAGHKVTMVDLPNPKAASRVAAGLFNVVTGREPNKTWMADEMLEALHAFLHHPNFEWLQEYFHFMPIFKPFMDAKSYNDWMVKLQEPDFIALGQHVSGSFLPAVIHNPIGGLRIAPCGWAETILLCDGILATLARQYHFQHFNLDFDYDLLDPMTAESKQAAIADIYDEVIFAEGMGILANPWFQFVEIRPLKGQILELKLEDWFPEDMILLHQKFLIPKGNALCTAGSTYELHYEDDEPNAEGIENIRASVQEVITVGFEVLSVRAAIRPTTPNRRPILGRHHEYPKLIVINGMGTKGVLQAPYSAKLLRKWLDDENCPLSKDVAVARFLKKNL